MSPLYFLLLCGNYSMCEAGMAPNNPTKTTYAFYFSNCRQTFYRLFMYLHTVCVFFWLGLSFMGFHTEFVIISEVKFCRIQRIWEWKMHIVNRNRQKLIVNEKQIEYCNFVDQSIIKFWGCIRIRWNISDPDSSLNVRQHM